MVAIVQIHQRCPRARAECSRAGWPTAVVLLLILWLVSNVVEDASARQDSTNSAPSASSHWAFQPLPRRVEPGRPFNTPDSIDTFIRARLKRENLSMSREA